MFMVDLIIILFHLKSNKLYCIGGVNWLKCFVVIHLLFFFFVFFGHIKMSYYWFNRQELLQKA